MSARVVLAAGAVLMLAGARPVAGPVAPVELARACAGKDGWDDPAPPALLAPGTYYVGTCGVAALLVTGPAGHVLIDGITEKAAPLVAANIERLGYRLSDVKLLLNSHEHLDHAGGLAALKKRTGAQMLARAEARPGLETGRVGPGDPQAGFGSVMPPVRVDGVLRDGQVVRLGPLRLTAHATPGHSPGATSWTWDACDKAGCKRVAYADSLSALAAKGYRYTDHPAYLAAFRRGIERVAALPCDILVTPHPQASDLFQRMAGAKPLEDTGACARYAEVARAKLDARVTEEAR
jgi:metallo-beta-lactamase class B